MDLKHIKEKFIELYGGSQDDLRVFYSPGRVNLIGEHTDYNGGYVFPAALTMGTTIVARPRKDNILNLAATDLEVRVNATLDNLQAYKNLKWGNYQLGVADELLKAGYKLVGCDMLFDDTLPHGGGLSSSAAIEVATGLALATLGKNAAGDYSPVDMKELAKIGQKTEHNYVGVNCGIMDQFASAMGKKDHAIFLDCKDLKFEHVPLKISGYKILISNTNVKRSLAHSKYNERREQCENGLRLIQSELNKAECLGDISLEEFEKHSCLIKDEVILKRVLHVISEDDRVLKSVKALNNNDIVTFGKLMTASHNSLRDLYEVTGIELDTLVEEALKIDGVLGSRMTGAGFGGCTVSLVKEDSVDEFIETVGKNYEVKTGLKASFYVSEVGDGGHEIK